MKLIEIFNEMKIQPEKSFLQLAQDDLAMCSHLSDIFSREDWRTKDIVEAYEKVFGEYDMGDEESNKEISLYTKTRNQILACESLRQISDLIDEEWSWDNDDKLLFYESFYYNFL